MMTDSMKKLILVADDDAMNREIMEAFLSSENYDVALANNGKTALQKAASIQPDLIILDVKMPDMTGYDVCQQIRQQQDTPIMIVTGFDAKSDRDRALQVGASAFFPRPFKGDDLLVRVKQLLRD